MRKRGRGRPRGGIRLTERYQVKTLSPQHKSILEWIVRNTDCNLKDCAAAFGRSPAWIYMLVRTDLFQEELEKAQATSMSMSTMPLRQKLLAVGHQAVEKLGEKVADSQDAKFILEAADKTLHRLGYAPTRGPEDSQPAQVVNQQNLFVVDQQTLAQARERMQELAGPLGPGLPATINGPAAIEAKVVGE